MGEISPHPKKLVINYPKCSSHHKNDLFLNTSVGVLHSTKNFELNFSARCFFRRPHDRLECPGCTRKSSSEN